MQNRRPRKGCEREETDLFLRKMVFFFFFQSGKKPNLTYLGNVVKLKQDKYKEIQLYIQQKKKKFFQNEGKLKIFSDK